MADLMALLDPAARTAAEALLNGALQGVLLTAGVAGALRLLPRLNPATRHAVWCAALLVVAALPLAALRGESTPFPAAASGTLAGGEASPAPAWRSPAVRLPAGPWLPPLVGGAALVALLGLLRLGVALRGLRRLKRASHPLPQPHRDRLRALAEAHARRAVEFRLSRRLATPVTVGFLHPVVLVPEGLLEELDPAELAQVALHELAHVRRRDDWTNLAQRTVQAVLFFHPAVRWIGRRMELEREMACDDYVASSLGGERAYARSLTRLAELALAGRATALAPGAAPRGGELTLRVHALLSAHRTREVGLAPGRAAALVALLLAAGAGLAAGAPGVALAVHGEGTSRAATPAERIREWMPEPPPAPAPAARGTGRPEAPLPGPEAAPPAAAAQSVARVVAPAPVETMAGAEVALPVLALPLPRPQAPAGGEAPAAPAAETLSAHEARERRIALGLRLQPPADAGLPLPAGAAGALAQPALESGLRAAARGVRLRVPGARRGPSLPFW